MTGLILKDALVLKKTLKTYLLLLAVYAVLAAVGVFSVSFVTAFLEVIALMLPMSAFAFDEQAHWDRYAAALPLSRRDIVMARYAFTLLVLLTALFALAMDAPIPLVCLATHCESLLKTPMRVVRLRSRKWINDVTLQEEQP